MTPTLLSGPLDPEVARHSVNAVLSEFLEAQSRRITSTHFAFPIRLLHEFLQGGKRFRPLLCLTGWQAVHAGDDPGPAVRVAACLELFHAFTLIHDDVMDESDTRRGRPTVHRAMAAHHAQGRARHEVEQLGLSAAVLLGDLAFTWSDELLHDAGLEPARLGAVLPLLSEMRTEVMLGQYLDLQATGTLTDDVEATLTVSRYKTAKYTVERPLHIGAAIAGAGPETMEALSSYALPLGEAFQLRDDLLGVYGDPRATGKSTLDDLRTGKNTTLTAVALHTAGPAQREQLRSLLGDPGLDESGATAVRAIFAATGARAAVEAMIERRRDQALQALETAPFTQDAQTALRRFAHQATVRNS